MEILSNIFGSRVRVKVLRLFMLNPERAYATEEIVMAAMSSEREVGKELKAFEKAGLIKRKIYYKDSTSRRKKNRIIRVKFNGWTLDPSFIYLAQLRGLLVNTIIVKNRDLVKKLGRAANLKLVAIAGIFIQNWDSRIDLLIVGDRLKRGRLERIIRRIESDIGTELQYTIMDTADFQYRASVGDRLVRDIFDYPHQVILDKIGLKAD
jgi:hypothetical protein